MYTNRQCREASRIFNSDAGLPAPWPVGGVAGPMRHRLTLGLLGSARFQVFRQPAEIVRYHGERLLGRLRVLGRFLGGLFGVAVGGSQFTQYQGYRVADCAGAEKNGARNESAAGENLDNCRLGGFEHDAGENERETGQKNQQDMHGRDAYIFALDFLETQGTILPDFWQPAGECNLPGKPTDAPLEAVAMLPFDAIALLRAEYLRFLAHSGRPRRLSARCLNRPGRAGGAMV